ncbi:MAG TPA: 2-dehydropantoate 2-reductase [Alphaproteobacteria bacterium]|nr:2-dehydropantoate 2-reductase [Alphaproteobacteria bacterium]
MALTEPLLIWGAGAIGGTIGAHLARAGHAVIFVDNVVEHVAAIERHGLRIEGPIAQFDVKTPAYTPNRLSGSFARILLCVKAHHTEAAANALRPFLSSDGYVVSMQNGLNELVIASIVGWNRTIGAFVNFGADYLEPGVVLYGGRGAVVLGELDGKTTPRLTALHEEICDFEPEAIVTENIWGYLWGKLGYGTLLFATALTNDSIADALAIEEYADLYGALGREVMAVAEVEGVKPEGFNGFDPDAFTVGANPAQLARSIAAMVAHNRKSAKSHSGIWRDLAVRKRKTEIDAQIAIIAEIGEKHGRRSPLIRRLVALIHDIEDGRLGLERTNLGRLAEALAQVQASADVIFQRGPAR